jgi:hypothetical protein
MGLAPGLQEDMRFVLRSVGATRLGLSVLDLTARRATVLGADEEDLLLEVSSRLAGKRLVAIGNGVSGRREVTRVVELLKAHVPLPEPTRFSAR